MAVKYTSYDDVYKAYAWRDNRRRLIVTQGEGLSSSSTDSNTYIKTAKFQLRDEQGAIELPNSTTAVSLALKKPNGMEVLVSAFYNYTDSATTKSEDRENGIVYFAITQSMTDIAGEVSGEIRLTTSTGIIKFYGINFYVYDGVSSNAAIQSNDFDHLVNALNKVEALTGGGTIATLDSVIESGGLHPVVSGVIYDFVNGNYERFQNCEGSDINSANDSQCIYRHHISGAFKGLVIFPDWNNYAGTGVNVTQYRFCRNGRIEYRIGTTTNTSAPNTYSWDKAYNEDWHPIGSTQNIQDLAVTTAKLANGAVTSAKIGNGEVKTANIDSNAVTSAKIADGNVTSAKIGSSEVKTANIENSAVTTAKIADGNVTDAKLANKKWNFVDLGTATNNNIFDNNTNSETIYVVKFSGDDCLFFKTGNTQVRYIHDAGWQKRQYVNQRWEAWQGAIFTDSIQDGAVTSGKIGSGEVKNSNIADGAITMMKLADANITPNKLDRTYTEYETRADAQIDVANNCNCIYRHVINGGYKGLVFFSAFNNYAATGVSVAQYRICRNGRIEYRIGTTTNASLPNTYSWDKTYDEDWHPIGSTQNIQDGAVTTGKIDSKAVTRAKIADGAVDTAQLAYAAVTTDNIDSNAVGTDEMADGAVTTSKLAASAVTTAKVANGSITPEKLSKAYVDHAPEIFIGTTDKTTTENGTSTKQYSELDRYINKYNGKIWVCTNATQVSDAWVYTWSEKGNFYNYPAQVSYPLNKNAWSNNQIELSGQLWAVADGRKRVDVDIDQTTYLQLCADGCAGLFVSTDDSGSTPVFTMNAIGNVPTTDITVQLTLWHVIDL